MKTIGSTLAAHQAGEVTTLATLWRITRRDAQVFGFTDHDRDIVYQGQTYEAASGYTASAIRTSGALDVDNMDIDGMLSSESITDEDLMAGVWDHAAILILRVNYVDLAQGHEVMRAGWLGNVQTGRAHFTSEIRGMTQALQQATGRVFLPACDADLGDARCGINLATYTVTGSVTSVASQSGFTDSARGETTGWFDYAKLTFTSGGNAGFSMEVKTFTAGGAFVLQQALPNPIAASDAYSVHAGCDKLLATCKDRFSNVINFRGCPHVPGLDRMMSGK